MFVRIVLECQRFALRSWGASVCSLHLTPCRWLAKPATKVRHCDVVINNLRHALSRHNYLPMRAMATSALL
jgi:hypothetical protein